MQVLRILGIDPGTAITGYGCIQVKGSHLEMLTCGVIRTRADWQAAARLRVLHDRLSALIREYQPDVVAVEQLFFNTNVTTALAVGQARGVVLLTVAQSDIPVFEYTPLQVKQVVTGQGRAAKQQVGYMVKVLLGLPEIPRPDDATDALAVAICHAHLGTEANRLLKYGRS